MVTGRDVKIDLGSSVGSFLSFPRPLGTSLHHHQPSLNLKSPRSLSKSNSNRMLTSPTSPVWGFAPRKLSQVVWFFFSEILSMLPLILWIKGVVRAWGGNRQTDNGLIDQSLILSFSSIHDRFPLKGKKKSWKKYAQRGSKTIDTPFQEKIPKGVF